MGCRKLAIPENLSTGFQTGNDYKTFIQDSSFPLDGLRFSQSREKRMLVSILRRLGLMDRERRVKSKDNITEGLGQAFA